MASSENFYGGSTYKTRSGNYGNLMSGYETRVPVSAIGLAVDARTANQIKGTSEKINTGAGTIEVQMLTPDVSQSIPNQHLEELNRLKQITGVDLTLHGELIEPTGVSKQGWEESDRKQAEIQMWTTLERGHKLDPKGNIVVTFHASNGLPEPETKFFDKEKGEEIKTVWVVDERTGNFSSVTPRYSYFKDKKDTPDDALNKQNEEAWYRALQHVNYNASLGLRDINMALSSQGDSDEEGIGVSGKDDKNEKSKQRLLKAYASFLKGEESKIPDKDFLPAEKRKIQSILHGDVYFRESYGQLQELFNQAYYTAEKNQKAKDAEMRKKAEEDMKRLTAYREEIKPLLDTIEKPENVVKLGEEIVKGVQILRSVGTPKSLTPLKEFAIDKASTTFANVALKSYDKFGDTSPIISIENPPAGMGLSRADEIKAVIEESHKKFIEKATKSEDEGGFGLTKEEAKKKAEQIIGATWDVGHINMIRKHGYGDKELKKEFETIAPHLKHMHLSDNFGLEHTELPMGMGNVPMKDYESVLKKQFGDKVKEIKRIVETGNWYQHFQTTPLLETFEAFGSPIYGMKMAPYWNQTAGITGGYFAGYGQNPEVHHSIYGAGFSNLPVELGGQMAGKSRLSGNAME